MNLFSLTLIFLLIMDPFGNISYFLKALQHVPPERRSWVILREMLFALIAIMAFCAVGEWIFTALQVSETSVRLSSAVVLFLTAIKILFPTSDSLRARTSDGEPFVIPLAIPLIAGPSMLATVMLFAKLEPLTLMLPAIAISWLLATALLLAGAPLQRIVGNNGLLAVEKLVGMILVMLSIQRLGEGIQQFVTRYVA